MCKVKTGNAIRNLQDVQNLVTGIIFRQICSFTKTDLIDAVNHYMIESPIQNDRNNIMSVVDATLLTCVSNDWLTYQRGVFCPIHTIGIPSSAVEI